MTIVSKSVAEICRQYADLRNEDIKIIEKMAEMLQIVADLTQADIFIDCVTKDPDAAIVAAEAKPRTARSLYRFSVAGQLALRKNEPAVIRTMQTGFPTIGMRGISQEGVPIKQNVVPITNKSGRTIGVLIMEQDITEQVSQEQKVKDLMETAEHLSETLFKVAFSEGKISNILPDGLLILDKNGEITYYNIAARDVFDRIGFRGKEIKGKKIVDVLPELDFRYDVLAEQMYIETQIRVLNLAFTSVPLKSFDETAAGALMLIRDITEIRVKEKELMLQSVVIKEIHHRIKNNLQTVASLLRMQARRVDSEQTKKALHDSISRILSIAVVHEVLSKEGMDLVDVRSVLTHLIDMIIHNMVDHDRHITINLSCDSFTLFSRQATSLIMIVNELIHNALEHAFVNKSTGIINIEIKQKDNQVHLIVADNGVGFSKKDVNQSKSLGLNIIRTLVEEDLKGSIDIIRQNGTTVQIRFPHFIVEEVCHADFSGG
ncbi:MAG: PAS domain-containing sensor histidine kinase [Tepidanaerobacteraceae bacterium]